MTQQGPEPGGFLVLNKPAGVSSARVLNVLKGRLIRGVKVGHAGTLDPFATGVLVVLVGRATRQCERIMRLPKGYDAILRLGATTATLDPESPEIPTCDARRGKPADPRHEPPACVHIQHVLSGFVGEIDQVPPAFSALKVGGRRAYDLARGGEQVELAPRRVVVHRIDLRRYQWPELRIFVECGRGFYVRSLARDIGAALGTGAYLTALRRTFVGPFTEALAVAPDADPLAILPLSWLDEQA